LFCFFPCFVCCIEPKDLGDEVEYESVLRHFEGSEEKAEGSENNQADLGDVIPRKVFFHGISISEEL
jgi:hypothetical protein